nr:hypothetical protein [Kofleriaceae bacterium]
MRTTTCLLAAVLGLALVGCMDGGPDGPDSTGVDHGGDSDGGADPGPNNPDAAHATLADAIRDGAAPGHTADTTIGSVSGCTMYASISQGTRNGFGEVSCGNYENTLEVETCVEQLVTGGWQTINWTCFDYSNANTGDHHYVWATSYAVPYWTSGRWYQTQVWARVNGGAWGYLTSEGLKGP